MVGIDSDPDYLAQARFAAEVSGLEIEFRQLSVYDVGALGERFDLVIFMGVLYHLRHPLLALDLIHEHVARDLLRLPVDAARQRRGRAGRGGLSISADMELFEQPGFPRLHFIERRYADDPTNWWIPNRACVEAMLRSAGFQIIAHPEEEVFVCRGASWHRPRTARTWSIPRRGPA